MDRKEFAKILNSVVVSEGCDTQALHQSVLPISQALVQMMPEKLFRYRGCTNKSIEAFENDKVYTVTADMFNDPYDTLLKFDVENVKKMLDSLLSKEVFNSLADFLKGGMELPDIIKQCLREEDISTAKENILSLTDEADIDRILSNKKEYLKFLVDFLFPLLATYLNQRTLTISCFSETINSVTMWSHYSDYHKGFALEYSLRPLLSNGIQNVGVYPVIYDDKRFDGTSYIMWEFLKFLGIKTPNPDMTSQIKCTLYKSCQWEYEKEWRLIDSTIRDNFMQDIRENPPFISLKPTAIYYGRNISQDNKKKLHDIALTKNIKEYDMYIDYVSDKYEMLYRLLS